MAITSVEGKSADALTAPDQASAPAPKGMGIAALFTGTAFMGAGLLFMVQPMVARLVLPQYGGSATVWSTSSLFFQAMLLVGYLYVHMATTRLGRRRQLALHVLVLALPVMALPIALPSDAAPQASDSPVLWLLRALVLTIGLPFAVISTTGPLLQRWYSWTIGPRADDPYFLFAASNLGSFVGLLAYPLAVEPQLSLGQQRAAWSWAFAGFLVLTAICSLVAWRTRRPESRSALSAAESPESATHVPLPRRRHVQWFALAMLPSSLMLGVTAHISTDLAAIPLMWVLPLALYLGTFVMAFARTTRSLPVSATRAAVALAAVSALTLVVKSSVPILVLVGLDLTMLTVVAFAAHARLASSRPAAEHLTRFYLVLAAGGAAGGLLNGLVAPVLFDRVAEYPLALVAAALMGVGATRRGSWITGRYGKRMGAILEVALLVAGGFVAAALTFQTQQQGVLWLAIVPLVAVGAWLASRRAAQVAAVLAVLLFVLSVAVEEGNLSKSRTFYGTYRVSSDADLTELVHGTTLHGTQFRDARRTEPTTYYARSGPLGDLFDLKRPERVGVVGLGTGTIAAYGNRGQSMEFFEIDPEMVRIAQETKYFTYLSDSEADITVVTGDGRLRLAEKPSASYDLLALDAFSSDAIPVHLLTQEAIAMYAEKLRPGGLLAVHISSRMFELDPVVAAAADQLGWDVMVGQGAPGPDGATPTKWIVLAREGTTLSGLRGRDRWAWPGSRRVTWTDDYSSIMAVVSGFGAR